MSCPNCGAPTPEQATQCPSCGAQLQTAPVAGGGAPWGPPPGAPGPGFNPYPASEAANQPVTTAGELAGWWRRVGATLIDGIMLGVVSAIIGLGIGRAGEYAVEFVLGLIYVSALLVTRGQTIGMMVVGTRCVREGTGNNLAPAPAIGRYLLTELLGVTIIGGLLDVFWPLWDSKNQTIHDKAVHTVVVRMR